MSEVIVYQLEGQPMSVLVPCKCGLSVLEIGEKDVPDGVMFWIVDSSVIPEDRSMRDAWRLDTSGMGSNHGVGGAK